MDGVRMKLKIVIASLGVALWTVSGPVFSQLAAEVIQKLSVRELVANTDRLMNKTVDVEGTLRNRGRNYFTDLRLVLEDTGGNPEILVNSWLPIELPPRPGSEPSRPTLAEYLGR